MALVFGDRVYETSTTTGNGTLTLAGIGAANYRTFSDVIGNGNTCYYAIIHRNANEWEVGVGTVSAGALARTTVLMTSAGNQTKIVFSAGTKDVFNDMPAERIIALDAAGTGTTSLAGVAITAGAASFTTGAFSSTLQVDGSTTLGNTTGDLVTIASQTLIGHTASVGANPNILQIKASGTFGAALGIVSTNNEIAGSLRLSSSATNSITLQVDPDNLRASSEFTLSVDGTTVLTTSPTAFTVGASTFVVTAATGAVQQSGNLTISRANAGASVAASVANTSTTAGSAAYLAVETNATAVADASLLFYSAGLYAWAIGADADASAALVISRSTSLGTNNAVSISATNAVTLGSSLAITGALTGVTTYSGSSSATFNTGNTNLLPVVTINGGNSGQSLRFTNPAASSRYNWQIGSNIAASSSFEITPSTAADGTTFSTPAISIAATGYITLAAQPAFVAGSKYLVIDASGNVQVSALGPAS